MLTGILGCDSVCHCLAQEKQKTLRLLLVYILTIVFGIGFCIYTLIVKSHFLQFVCVKFINLLKTLLVLCTATTYKAAAVYSLNSLKNHLYDAAWFPYGYSNLSMTSAYLQEILRRMCMWHVATPLQYKSVCCIPTSLLWSASVHGHSIFEYIHQFIAFIACIYTLQKTISYFNRTMVTSVAAGLHVNSTQLYYFNHIVATFLHCR